MKDNVLMRRPPLLKVADFSRLALILVDNVGKGKVFSYAFNSLNWTINERIGLVERVVVRVCITLAWLEMFVRFRNRGRFTRRKTGVSSGWVRPVIQKIGKGGAQC